MSDLGKIDQFWECPKCSSQIGMGQPGRLTKAPMCSMGHPKAEMEQVMAGRFGRSVDDEDDGTDAS